MFELRYGREALPQMEVPNPQQSVPMVRRDKHDEFEVMFNNYRKDNKLAIIDFMNVMKYLKWRNNSDKSTKLKETLSLDVIYSTSKVGVYRVSINGIENINNFLGLVHQRRNNVVCLVSDPRHIC